MAAPVASLECSTVMEAAEGLTIWGKEQRSLLL